MPDVDSFCLVGKPVAWLDIVRDNLASTYLTNPNLVSKRFDAEFEQARWDAGAPRRG